MGRSNAALDVFANFTTTVTATTKKNYYKFLDILMKKNKSTLDFCNYAR